MPARNLIPVFTLAAAGLSATVPAHATPNLVTNGSFETTTNGNGELMPNQTTGTYITSAPGWYTTTTNGTSNATNNHGYPFLFIASNAVTTGFGDAWDNGIRRLWGATNNGLNTWDGTSPDGGNYLVMDGDYHHTAISQNISSLVAGASYAVSFEWAAAQWAGFYGATTETLSATLGSQTLSTATYSLPSQGFSGWMSSTFNFTYDGTSNVLSFLASGTPVGEPPMVLLDDVSLTAAVPEPASLALFGVAAGIGLAAYVRRRRSRGDGLNAA